MKKHLLLLLLGVIVALQTFATQVTAFTGTYRNGQVFFTWNNISSTNVTYRLYRSSSKITKGSQLASCEYLGYTNQASALNNNLTSHDTLPVSYWIIQTGGSQLLSTQGLFVTTTVANGSYYYALTTYTNKEDTSILVGTNSLSNPIAETIAAPQPVLQQTRMIDNKPVEIYGDFMTSRVKLNGPMRFKAGWFGYDFAIYRNNAVNPQALHVRFHAGGSDFLDNITHVSDTEVNLGVEDYFPDNDNSGWLGSNEAYDGFKKGNNSPPTTGTNYFYSIDRILAELRWVFAHVPVDSNRVSVDGTSFGSYGAFFFTLLHPDKVASADLTSGIFNFGFENDYNPACTMNPGQKNRQDGDKKFGTVVSNLLDESGAHTYDLLNGGYMIHLYNSRSYPVIFSTNGRNDDMLGWTEKTIWYDSVENNHLGGYYFYDGRDHAGDGKTWLAESQFDMYRYRANLSFPAFTHCSIDNNPGNGNGADGDQVGTVNGYLDWSSTITDDSTHWAVKMYMDDIKQVNNVYSIAPSSCTVDVTPRRLQHFNPPVGVQLQWSVTHLNQVVQSGSQTFNGGLITIPAVQIYKDSSVFQLTYSNLDTFYLDADNDTYGNVNSFVLAATQPAGYVTDHTDCNDGSNSIHPGAIEMCNSIDDNCNGLIDDGTSHPNAKINPQGDLNICNTGSVKLKAKKGTGIAWQWNKDGAAISGATKQSYTATATGDYTVLVTDAQGCTKKSKKVTVTSSCKEVQPDLVSAINTFKVEVSPNPATDFVQVKISSDEIGGATIQLLNLLGQSIFSSQKELDFGEQYFKYSVREIPEGLYYLKVIINGRINMLPIVIGNNE